MAEPATQTRVDGAHTTQGETANLELEAILAARKQADLLVSGIRAHADLATVKATDAEQAWISTEKSRAEVDGHLEAIKRAEAALQSVEALSAATKEQIQRADASAAENAKSCAQVGELAREVQKQLEATKSLLGEATDLRQNADVRNNQAVEIKGQAAESLRSIHASLATLTGDAENANAHKAEIEQARLAVAKSRTEIDAELTASKHAAAAVQQQVDSAKTLITEITTQLASTQKVSNETVEVKAQAGAALQSIQTALAAATENANRAEAVKVSAEQTQSVIATKSEHIEGGRLHADKVRGEIDRLYTEATQSTTNAEAQHQASRAVAENLNNLYAAAQTVKATTDSNAEVVAKLRQQCEDYATTAKRLADIAEATDKKVKEYEARLVELERVAAERLKTIEGILPSAASAGLASAFNHRRTNFKWPLVVWQVMFMLSMLALVGFAVWVLSLFSAPDSEITLEKLGISLLMRLPFALPLIWIAIHSSHQGALAQRVEEDYAFKETVSRAFEGFRREMAELEGKAAPESALAVLCAGVLSVITNPPGRIYEKHPLSKTAMNEMVESAASIADSVAKIRSKKAE